MLLFNRKRDLSPNGIPETTECACTPRYVSPASSFFFISIYQCNRARMSWTSGSSWGLMRFARFAAAYHCGRRRRYRFRVRKQSPSRVDAPSHNIRRVTTARVKVITAAASRNVRRMRTEINPSDRVREEGLLTALEVPSPRWRGSGFLSPYLSPSFSLWQCSRIVRRLHEVKKSVGRIWKEDTCPSSVDRCSLLEKEKPLLC